MLTQVSPFKVKEAAALDETKIEEFKHRLAGQLIRPGDAAYDEARRVWNGLIDKYPALIARVANVADVVAAVNFARENDLLVSVRGGGHNAAGHATNDGGLVIDLSLMKGIQVDPQARIVRVQGGVTWGELDQATQEFGLATPGGIVSTTGIAGLTLGGGLGLLRRKYGLSIDNLRSVEVVTADGQILTASKTENADLFWAVRGGGGNFGVVTSFEYTLHPVGPTVTLLLVMYPAAEAKQIIPAWRDFMTTAPEELSSNGKFTTVPSAPFMPAEIHGKPVFVLFGMYSGEVIEGERLIQPLRQLTQPVIDFSGPMPYTAVQSIFDPLFPKGELLAYWKSTSLRHLDDQVIDTISKWAATSPSSQTIVDLWAMGGAVNRVATDATAFGDRSAPFWLVFNTSWTDPQDTDKNIAWTRAFYEAVQPYSAGGGYLNFPGLNEDQDREQYVRASFGANYERLVTLKNKYDPTNLFRLNQNIKPTQEEIKPMA